jgi:hypothetical protein
LTQAHAQKALEKLEGINEDLGIGIRIRTTEVMVAEAPKDEEHEHGDMPDMGDMAM